jgi:hypothetical protein
MSDGDCWVDCVYPEEHVLIVGSLSDYAHEKYGESADCADKRGC